MSACMRSLNSSDQCALGFCLPLSCGRATGADLLSLGDLRAPIFSLRVGRRDEGLEGELELVMQLSVTSSGCHVSWDAEELGSSKGY